MKFETTFDFIKAVVENDGVLWREDGVKICMQKDKLDAHIYRKFYEGFEFFTTEPLKDKDFVECWDNIMTHSRLHRFWDAKNNCTFEGDGTRGGFSWSNYRKITTLPDWAIEAQKTLED